MIRFNKRILETFKYVSLLSHFTIPMTFYCPHINEDGEDSGEVSVKTTTRNMYLFSVVNDLT
jgi:hypothetical protein